ncbi:MAG TPA: polyphosphate polymerase domain-containing protein [Balneolaceae bacterium]|nr:polyphosphate polymerase domain-containing protein [Balneolaceae bacterium]
MIDRLQRQRFELKYFISEEKAQQIRFYVESFLKCDEFGITQPDRSYLVHSIYLDSPNMRTYMDTINGNRNRFKLRIRYYDHEDSPVFLEIKRRYNKVIRKSRARIHRHAIPELLGGQIPAPVHLVHESREQMDALTNFCTLLNRLNARPTVHVSYFREAYEQEGSNSVRVTFDRQVKYQRVTSPELFRGTPDSRSVFGKKVIFEIKFTDTFPHWLKELTQFFHLQQTSAAKYVDSIVRMREQK